MSLFFSFTSLFISHSFPIIETLQIIPVLLLVLSSLFSVYHSVVVLTPVDYFQRELSAGTKMMIIYTKNCKISYSQSDLTTKLGRIWWNFSHEETLLKVLGKTCSTWYRRRNESITVSESTTGSRQVLRSGQDSFSEVLSFKSPVLDPAHSLFVC